MAHSSWPVREGCSVHRTTKSFSTLLPGRCTLSYPPVAIERKEYTNAASHGTLISFVCVGIEREYLRRRLGGMNLGGNSESVSRSSTGTPDASRKSAVWLNRYQYLSFFAFVKVFRVYRVVGLDRTF